MKTAVSFLTLEKYFGSGENKLQEIWDILEERQRAFTRIRLIISKKN